MEDPIGKDVMAGRYRGEKKISIAGTHANDICETSELSCRFQKEGMPANLLLTVQFEMESRADDL